MLASRRRFLAWSAVGLAGCEAPAAPPSAPAPAAEPVPPPVDRWDPPGAVDRALFACGVQTGDPLPDSVLVSVRQFELPWVRIRVARWVGTWEELPPPAPLAASAGVAQLELVGLAADSEYGVVATDLTGARRSEVGRFRTAPAPGSARPVRFAAASCFGMDGAPFLSASRVAGLDPDFVVLLGDTIYVPAPGGWEDHWTKALAIDGLRELLLSAGVVATWDDHEVLDDWTWEDHADDAVAALAAFRRALPQRLGPGGSGIWRRHAWGDLLDVFVLDTRGERVGDEIVSEAQLEWLLDGLATSAARWKVVATSVPISDLSSLDPSAATAGWLGFPAQRARLLDAVRGRRDLLWIAGDIHLGVAGSVGPPGSPDADQYEVICSPAGSSIAVIADRVVPDAHHEYIVGEHHTGWFEVDADSITFTYVGDDGPVVTGVRASGST